MALGQVSPATGKVEIWRIPYDYLTLHEARGAGSYKSVHRGKFRSHEVAVLRFRPNAPADAAVSEAKCLTRLTRRGHPNLLRFFGYTSDPSNGTVCLVTEFASQGSLDGMLERVAAERRSLPPLMLAAAAEQIRAGMEAICSAGYLHRDLSLRNVLCFAYNLAAGTITVKVCDFGRARPGPVFVATDTEDVPIRWTAPETLLSNTHTEASEVWAFGVTVWEIVTGGRVPFQERDDRAVRQAVLAANGNLLAVPPRCPPALRTVMERCWSRSASRRPTFSALAAVITPPRDSGPRVAAIIVPNHAAVDQLVSMGFAAADATDALRNADGNVEAALNALLGQ